MGHKPHLSIFLFNEKDGSYVKTTYNNEDMMRFIKSALAALTLTAFTSTVYAAPTPGHSPVQTAPASQTPPQTQTAAPAQQTKAEDSAKQTGPQPGKPLQFVGPSFVMFGEKTLQIGTVDMSAKKMLSSIILSPPWDVDGTDICGTDSLSKTGNVCVSFSKTGSVSAPGGVVLPTVHKADLAKVSPENTTVYCDDCTITRASGLFHTDTVTGIPVISKKSGWVSFTGEPIGK